MKKPEKREPSDELKRRIEIIEEISKARDSGRLGVLKHALIAGLAQRTQDAKIELTAEAIKAAILGWIPAHPAMLYVSDMEKELGRQQFQRDNPTTNPRVLTPEEHRFATPEQKLAFSNGGPRPVVNQSNTPEHLRGLSASERLAYANKKIAEDREKGFKS